MKIRLAPVLQACAAALFLGTSVQAPADDAILKPTAQQADAMLWTARILERYRYKPELPVERRSVRDAYLDALDPDGLLFTQADILAFQEPGALLDKDLDKPGPAQLEAAFAIFSTWQARQTEMANYALAALRRPLDFSGNGRYQRERAGKGNVARPASETALRALWQARVMDDVLNLRIAGASEALVVPTLERRYGQYLARARAITAPEAFETYMNAYASTLDPHGAYIRPAEARKPPDLRASTGLVLVKRDDLATVVGEAGGGPAQRSGALRRGDRIVAVAQGAEAPPVEVIGWAVNDVIELLRGAAGSTVVLSVLPADARPGDRAALRRVSLVRAAGGEAGTKVRSQVETVGQGTRARRIGVVVVPTFYEDHVARRAGAADYTSMARDVAGLLQKLKADKVDALLLDMRGNGGGALDEATRLAALFMPGARMSWQRTLAGKLQADIAPQGQAAWDGPLGVLIDQGSAAATEIFASAVQDHGRGLVIGENSFGRSSVQTSINLDRFVTSPGVHYGDLKLTVAQLFRAGGANLDGRGALPDIAIPGMPEPSGKANRLLFPAAPLKVAPIVKLGDPAALVPVLAERHAARTRADGRYQAMLRARAQFEARRASDEVALNETERRREAAALVRVDLRQVQFDEAVRVMGDAVDLVREDPALARALLPAAGG